MKAIVVSGTPGTGKTTVAKTLAKKLSAKYLNINKLIKPYKLAEGYDKQRKTKIIDIKKLKQAISKEINKTKKRCIIDSHLAHELPKKSVAIVIITTCNLKTLQQRLKKRNYSKEKIRENLDAEIFDTCYEEAKERHQHIIKLNASKSFNLNNLIKRIKTFI